MSHTMHRTDPDEIPIDMVSGLSHYYVLDKWQPVSREVVENAPAEGFWCEVETSQHTFKLKDGARIKKSILNNMGA